MRKFWKNHGFTRMSFARALARGFAVPSVPFLRNADAFLRRIHARSIWAGTSRQFEKGQALAQTIRVIRGLKLVALTIALLSMGLVSPRRRRRRSSGSRSSTTVFAQRC